MRTNDEDLRGQTAVVTGASSGIGRGVAERLGAAGAHVVLGGRTEAAMKESVGRIEAAGGAATAVVGDVRSPAVVQALVDLAVERTGLLDVMVNNAGAGYLGAVLSGTVDQWREMLETNVLALLVGCQAAIRAMRQLGTPGSIVNISSVAATERTSGVYGATKHAVNVISDTLRTELLEDPIRVTTIMPGVVATNLARTLPEETLRTIAALAGVDAEVVPGERIPDEVLERAQVALHEFVATPDDIADAVLYAVTRPADLHVAEIVVRPKKDLAL